MRQRIWPAPTTHPLQRRRSHNRPWLLIEDPSPVAQVSDFSLFHEAGFDVAVCSGPDRSNACPLADGLPCRLVDAADVVLFGLDLDQDVGQRVLRAHLDHYPETPVVVEVPRDRQAQLPEEATACTVLRSPSVAGQTRSLWKALCEAGWGRHHEHDTR